MADKIDPIPDEMTIAEASEFWDEHSVADYASHVVEFEYAPDDHITVVAIAADIVELLRRRAREKGISVETLVNLWVQEKLMTS